MGWWLWVAAWAAPAADPHAAAAAEFAALAPRLADPDPAVDAALRALVAAWGAGTTGVGAERRPVVVPAVERARRALGLRATRPRVYPEGALGRAVLALPAWDRAAWEDGVRGAVVVAADLDRDGVLDTPAELERAGCEVWEVVIDRANAAEAGDFGRRYAVDARRLGIDPRAQDAFAAAARACDTVPVTAAALLDGLGEVSEAGWTSGVRWWLLRRFDADGSGAVDVEAEVRAVPCEDWRSLDAAARARGEGPLYQAYGFVGPASAWRGRALGVGDVARATVAATLSTCGLSAAATRASRDVAASIRALPGGGSDAWDRAVRLELLRFDADGSGLLDVPAELDAVGCEVWTAVDQGVRQAWPLGLWTTYGVAPGGTWLGEVLGLAESARAQLDAILDGCGVGRDAAGAPRPLADRLRALPELSDAAWLTEATRLVLQVHDTDRSGALDTAEEVLAVPCPAWTALDRRVPDLPEHLARVRVAAPMLPLARRAVDACLAEATGPGHDPAQVAAWLDRLTGGGTVSWDDAVRPVLVAAFDRDDSGLLDRADEVRAIPCPVWTALDRAVRGRWPAGLLVTYGFDPGSPWVGYQLGVALPVGALAADAAARCGVTGRGRPDRAAPWAEVVGRSRRAILAGDLDASGAVDTAAEVDALACATWSDVDAMVRASRADGVAFAFGLAPTTPWAGDAIGLHARLKDRVFARVQGCGLLTGDLAGRARVFDVPSAIITLPGRPGEQTWSYDVGALLRGAWDADGSGWLDRPAEIAAVDCATWEVLDQRVREAWAPKGVVEVYGVRPGAPWLAGDLGVPEAMRGALRRRLRVCRV